MDNKTVDSAKIKRRNFFLYLGALAAGIFSINKLPGKIFKSKISSKINSGSIRHRRIKVIAHPQAVKRESKGMKSG